MEQLCPISDGGFGGGTTAVIRFSFDDEYLHAGGGGGKGWHIVVDQRELEEYWY